MPDSQLDVNNNGTLTDAVDGLNNFVPGYVGAKPVLSSGSTWLSQQYKPQPMNLILDGVGTETGIDRVRFGIWDVSQLPGYAGNASDPSIDQADNNDDFSFSARQNQRDAYGTMGSKSTSVTIWNKDYGGTAEVDVYLEKKDNDGNFQVIKSYTIQLPVDEDRDGIADKWEVEKVLEWESAYHVEVRMPAIDFFGPDDDREHFGPPSPVDAQKLTTADLGVQIPGVREAADGLAVASEYRGYILDGGNYDGKGHTSFTGGHVRLSPSQMEIMIDVDQMATVPAAPAAGMPANRAVIDKWMTRIVKSYSQETNGTEITGYYVVHHGPNNKARLATLDPAVVKTDTQMRQYMAQYVNEVRLDGFSPAYTGAGFTYGFRHLLLARQLDAIRRVFGRIEGFSNSALAPASERFGSVVALTNATEDFRVLRNLTFFAPKTAKGAAVPNGIRLQIAALDFDTFVSNVIAHELAHTLVTSNVHFPDADGNGTPDEASDFETILFDYTSTENGRVVPVDYWAQDYIAQRIKYGPDVPVASPKSGFLKYVFIGRRTLSSQ